MGCKRVCTVCTEVRITRTVGDTWILIWDFFRFFDQEQNIPAPNRSHTARGRNCCLSMTAVAGLVRVKLRLPTGFGAQRSSFRIYTVAQSTCTDINPRHHISRVYRQQESHSRNDQKATRHPRFIPLEPPSSCCALGGESSVGILSHGSDDRSKAHGSLHPDVSS